MLSSADAKVQRCVWLGIVLSRGRKCTTFASYRKHFAGGVRTYQRDLATMRRIGFVLESVRDHAVSCSSTPWSVA